MDTQLATISLPIGSVDSYITRVNQIPMLTPEQEKSYAHNFKEHDNIDDARKMVLAHLRYVVRVARGYVGYGLPLADLIQEGNLGLMKAVKRFDPGVGVRLVSFAVHWIKAEIHEFVIKNWRIVKVATTKAQRKLFFNLRSMKQRLGWFTDDEVNNVASSLGVSREEVLRMEQRLNAMDAPYDGPELDDDMAFLAPSHTLAASNADPSLIVETNDTKVTEQSSLYQAIELLDERSQDILQRRWLNDKKSTLHELASDYGVSAERIRQLEKIAMKKVKQQIEVI
jgi:RNA polymerase sigma-32 factor